MKKIYIVAISGKMLSGKTTLKNLLIKELDDIFRNDVVVIHKALATPLKNCLETLRIKSFKKDIRVRSFLQSLGDLVRNLFGSDFFIRYLINEILDEANKLDRNAVYIIDDLRFVEEFNLLAELMRENVNIDVLFIRVTADDSNRRLRAKLNDVDLCNINHKSEVDLDHIDTWDLVVDNNSTIDDLYKNYIKELAQHIALVVS